MRRGLIGAAVALAALCAPAVAQAGTVKAGAATVDASWHVGASAGQYASDGSAIDPGNGNYDPTAHSYKRSASYGIQSRLKVRAIVVEGPSGNRFALVKNDLYIPQDLLYRRTAQLLEAQPALGIDRSKLTMAVTHDHSSPYYSSPSWGVWAFQDVFDVRFYNYYAGRMAEAVKQAVGNLEPARVGASVTQFDKTHRHSYGPAIANDGTPAGYPNSNTDHDMTVVRFDDLGGDPIANIVNYALHPEFLDGNDLISADFLAPLQEMTDRATNGAVTVFTQGSVGTAEPERSTYHSIHERLEFSDRQYGQAEFGARLMSDAIVDTWKDIADNTPDDPARFIPFDADFANDEVAMRDQWFPGPTSHPYPGVSSCRTDTVLAGNPQLPVAGLPDCAGPERAFDEAGFGGDVVPALPIDPGLSTDDFQRAGVPVPENYSAPAYTGLEEDINVHLQAFRIGDILFTICSCEQWYDQSKNIESRTDRVPDNQHLGFDWKNEGGPAPPPPAGDGSGGSPGCTKNNDGTYGAGPDGYGTGTWKCVNPGNPSQNLPDDLSDQKVERMHRQVTNEANGWNDPQNVASAESEPTNLTQIKGNSTHDDRCPLIPPTPQALKPYNDYWNKPCLPAEESPSAKLGYKLTVPIGMGNDYNGYIASYREYQQGDHYRKALTAWGPHSMDYMASRLVNMGRVLNGGDAGQLLPDEVLDSKIDGDLANNDARATALGETGGAAIQGYEARLPDDGGTPGPLTQPPDIERFDGTFFTWVGGSNFTDNPTVKLQREVGANWEDYAGQSSELPVTLEYPNLADAPAYESGNQVWRWSAHYEAFATRGFKSVEGSDHIPAGTYRFVVKGNHRKNRAVQEYNVTSAKFEIRPWGGITVTEIQEEIDGTISFKLGPRSQRTAAPGVAGEVGPIDYPNTYTYPEGGPLPRFIRNNLTGFRDPAAPNDFSQVEWFCTNCSFRPWRDVGDGATAKVTFEGPGGVTEEVTATKVGDRWRTTRTRAPNESAYVAAGCVRDQFDDFNGAASARVGAPGDPPGETNACGDVRPALLTVDDVEVDEGDAGVQRAEMEVTLSAPRPGRVTVDFATAGDGASEGDDYSSSSGRVTFDPGETSESIELDVMGDTADEPDERFLVNLSNPVGASLADTQGAVTIKDDDEPAAGGGAGQGQGGGGSTGGGSGGQGGTSPGGNRPGVGDDIAKGLRGGRCALPTGRVKGRKLGQAKLGGRRRGHRKALPGLRKPRKSMDRFCMGKRHLRIGYATRRVLSRLGRPRRDKAARKAVLIMVSHPHYTIRRVKAGSSLRTLKRRVRRLRSWRIGANRWYLAPGSRARLVFKVRGRRVREVGIADKRLSRGRRAVPFLRGFQK